MQIENELTKPKTQQVSDQTEHTTYNLIEQLNLEGKTNTQRQDQELPLSLGWDNESNIP